MISIPVTAEDHLPYVIAAAKRDGYMGLMVVLARTAEARDLHEELTRDWTSIHDVTGQALAVLCPEPHFVPENRFPADPRDVADEDWRAYERVAMSRHSSLRERPLESYPLFDHTRLITPGCRSAPVPRYSPHLQHAAWTEAVARCASYFRVPESRLPALLVVCLREEDSVLIQLDEAVSVYQLCKRIASHPGYPPEDRGLLTERDKLRDTVSSDQLVRKIDPAPPPARPGLLECAPSDPVVPRTMQGLLELAAVRKQTDGLQRHLVRVADVDPDLCREIADGLRARVEADTAVDAVLAWLSDQERRIASHPHRTDLLYLDAKLRKVARSLETNADPEVWRQAAHAERERLEREYAQEHARWEEDRAFWERRHTRLERDLARLAELERRLADRPGLAAACEDAARAVLGTCEVEPLTQLSRPPHFRGDPPDPARIRVVRPTGPQRQPAVEGSGPTRNTLAETTVYGSAVQAGNIDALHLHLPGNAQASSRRSGPGLIGWLRGARRRRREDRS